jgi:type I restriction enzyme R subunit
LGGKTLRSNQIEFVNLIIDHLTDHGSMDARLLYDSPYTDFSPRGVDGVFESEEVDELVSVLDDVRKRAVA